MSSTVVGNKDWVGGKTSVFAAVGASSHSNKARAVDDYYATSPKAIDLLCGVENFDGSIWEPACGAGHMSKALEEKGHTVVSTDLVYRGYGKGGVNFLEANSSLGENIITNPPYKYAKEFVEKAIDIVDNGKKVAMFLKLQFLEGKARRELFDKYPLKTVWVSSERLMCARNGDFDDARKSGSAVAYAWFIWQKGYKGDTVVRWL